MTNDDLSPRAAELRTRVAAFLEEHILPAEAVFETQLRTQATRWAVPPIVEELKAKAKAQGLWNLFLPDSDRGAGLTNHAYATLCEVMGRSPLGCHRG